MSFPEFRKHNTSNIWAIKRMKNKSLKKSIYSPYWDITQDIYSYTWSVFTNQKFTLLYFVYGTYVIKHICKFICYIY